ARPPSRCVMLDRVDHPLSCVWSQAYLLCSSASVCIFFPLLRSSPTSALFPYTTLFRSVAVVAVARRAACQEKGGGEDDEDLAHRSEEHTSELQSRENLVCRLLLEKKKRYSSKWGRGQGVKEMLEAYQGPCTGEGHKGRY